MISSPMGGKNWVLVIMYVIAAVMIIFFFASLIQSSFSQEVNIFPHAQDPHMEDVSAVCLGGY